MICSPFLVVSTSQVSELSTLNYLRVLRRAGGLGNDRCLGSAPGAYEPSATRVDQPVERLSAFPTRLWLFADRLGSEHTGERLVDRLFSHADKCCSALFRWRDGVVTD